MSVPSSVSLLEMQPLVRADHRSPLASRLLRLVELLWTELLGSRSERLPAWPSCRSFIPIKRNTIATVVLHTVIGAATHEVRQIGFNARTVSPVESTTLRHRDDVACCAVGFGDETT